MRKDSSTAKLTEIEIERNKSISKVRYIVEQYFGISHLHDQAKRARFTTTTKNKFDGWCRQVYPVKFEDYLTGTEYNIRKGLPRINTLRCSYEI